MINMDETPQNQDWTKTEWDLPPYKSKEFRKSVTNLKKFRKLPVYKWAVKNGLIKKDKWVKK